MRAIAIFRIIQISFIVLLMLFITYCNRAYELKREKGRNKSAEAVISDTLKTSRINLIYRLKFPFR